MSAAPTDPMTRAEQFFADGFACSQAVLLAFAPRLGLPPETAARLASSFGGGMARCGWTCGAVAGALMAVGLHAGNAAGDDSAHKEDNYLRVRALLEQFRREHGATDCRTLLGFDIGDPEKRREASEAGIFSTVCPRFVRTAAALAQEALDTPRL